MKVKIEQAKQTWESPNGQRRIYQVVDGDGNVYKTMSDAIGKGEGRSFDVETYEKDDNRGGTDTFLKQVARQDGQKFAGKTGQKAQIVSQKSGCRADALSCAVEFACGHLAAGEKITIESVLLASEKMLKWLDKDNSSPEPTTEDPEDLPF